MGNGGLSGHSSCPSGKTLAARHAEEGFTRAAWTESPRIADRRCPKWAKVIVIHQLFLMKGWRWGLGPAEQLLWEETRVLPRQAGDVLSPMSQGLLQDEHAWNTSLRKCLGSILATCPHDFSWLHWIWKSRRPPLSAISGWLNSLLYLYAWTRPPCRRIRVICICRLVILVPTYPQLLGPELMLRAT